MFFAGLFCALIAADIQFEKEFENSKDKYKHSATEQQRQQRVDDDGRENVYEILNARQDIIFGQESAEP